MSSNNSKIIVPTSTIFEAALNLNRVINSAHSAAATGLPYLRGLVKVLNDRGMKAQAKSINEDYLEVLAATQRLLTSVAPLLRNQRI